MEKINIKIKRKLYPGRTDVIPPQLPVAYKPSTSPGVPSGQKCENCFFYQNGFCDFWKAPVEKDYWCKTWRNTPPNRADGPSPPCVSGSTVTLCLTEDFNDIGVYTPFDGMMVQRDVVTNFIYTGDGYNITVFNSSDFQFKKFLEFSDYVLNWGDGSIDNLSITTPIASHTYTPNQTGYTITLEQINPWGTVYVSKHISLPYTMNYPSAGNMFGTIELKPPGFETPIGCSSIFQDYIFSGDSNPDVIDHFSSAQGNFGRSIPFYITGESESHLTILQNWGPNMYLVNVPVNINGNEGTGIINYITETATGYTINDILYIDTSGGTTFSGYTYGLDSRNLDHICCNYTPIAPCECNNAVGAFVGWFGEWQAPPPPSALAVGDPSDYDAGMIVEFGANTNQGVKCYWRTGYDPGGSAGHNPQANTGHWELCAASLITPQLQRQRAASLAPPTPDNKNWSQLITENYSVEDYLRDRRLEQAAAISEPKPQYQKQIGSGPNYCCSSQIDKYGYALTVDMQYNQRVMQGWSNNQYYCDCNYSNVPNDWYTGSDSIGANDPPTHVFRHPSTGWIGSTATASSSCQPNGPVNANSPFGTACGGHPDNWGASYWGPSAAGYQQVDDNLLWQSDNCYDGYSTDGCYWCPWPACCKNSWTASSGKRSDCTPYVYGCMDDGNQSTQSTVNGQNIMDSFIMGVVADNLGTVSANYGDNWPRNAGPANTVNYGQKPDHAGIDAGSYAGCFYTIQACLDPAASNYMRGVWDDSGNFVTGSLGINLNVVTQGGTASWVTINPCNTAGGTNDCCYYSAGCTYNVGTGVFESALPFPPNTPIVGDHLNTSIVQVGPYVPPTQSYAQIYPSLASMPPGPLQTCGGNLYNPPNAAPYSYIIDDGSCIIDIPGCQDPSHPLYCPYSTFDSGCPDPAAGCMDPTAINFNPSANLPCDDPLNTPPCSVPSPTCCCEYPVYGCMDPLAENYQENCAGDPVGMPDVDDGCCEYAGVGQGCPDPLAINYGGPTVLGCGSPPNPNDTSCCTYPAYGCTDPLATNYNPLALIDDGTCIYPEMEVPVGLNPYNGHEIELCMSAITKEEVLINVCQEVEIQSELFINRGKQSVFESSQRLGEIDTIGALEIYGYGFYQINQELTKSTKWH